MSMPGPTELIIILAIVILIFGAKRIPLLGESLGKGLRYFKDAITGKDEKKCCSDKEQDKLDEKP